MNDPAKSMLEHAWRYFEMHAAQRITVFNFFVATSGLLIAGLVFALRAGKSASSLGIAAGLALIALAFLFWKLDQRVSSMIKESEKIIAKIEESAITDPSLRVIAAEQKMTSGKKFTFWENWTYGQAFRRIFIVVGLVGFIGIVGAIGNAANWGKAPPSKYLSSRPTALNLSISVDSAANNRDEKTSAPPSTCPPTESKSASQIGGATPH